MEVGLGPGHIVLDGEWSQLPVPLKGAQQPPTLSIVAKRSPISATAEHLLTLVNTTWPTSH